MHGNIWVGLLRSIPPGKLDQLALILSNGMEINLQALVRLERDYVVFRGRPGGSLEGGKVFLVPYDRLSHLCSREPVAEADINELFCLPTSPSSPEEREEGPGLPPEKKGPGEAGKGSGTIPVKSVLLERLRRSRSDAAGGPPQPPSG